MDIGVYSFLFFLVALPGIIFRRFYYQGEFSKQFTPRYFVLSLFYSSLIGVFILYLSICFYNSFMVEMFGWDSFSKQKVKTLILSCIGDNQMNALDLIDLLFLKSFIFKCLSLSLTIVFISWFSAIFSFQVVRILRLDKIFSFLRFSNYWYYYLRGEFLQFKDFKTDYKKIDLVYADVLLDTGNEGTKLYSGTLKQYIIDKSNDSLETLYLADVVRYKKGDPEPKTIPSHCFILPYSKIININLRVAYTKKAEKKDFEGYFSFYVKKYLALIMIVFAILPFIRGFHSLWETYSYPLFAKSLASIYFLLLPAGIQEISDKRKNYKERLNMVIGLIIIGAFFGVFYSLSWFLFSLF